MTKHQQSEPNAQPASEPSGSELPPVPRSQLVADLEWLLAEGRKIQKREAPAIGQQLEPGWTVVRRLLTGQTVGISLRYLEAIVEALRHPTAPAGEREEVELVQCDSDIDQLAAEVIEVCKARNWSLHWTARGAYLHLEASELIEAIRGKGDSTPQAEAADVLIVLMSITQNAGIRFSGVVNAAKATLQMLRMKPPYKGEERTDGRADELAAALAE